MFGYNEWQLVGIASLTIFCIWIALLILAEIWIYLWAWIDESKTKTRNYLLKICSKTIKSEWIYPVWNGPMGDGAPLGYAKEERFKDMKVGGLTAGYNLENTTDGDYKKSGDCSGDDKIWIYPVWQNTEMIGQPYGYAREKRFKNACIYGLNYGSDYKYSSSICRNEAYAQCLIDYVIITVLLPLITLLCIKFFMVVAILGAFFSMAHLARFSRRLSKKCSAHINDKKIHVAR